MIFDVLILGGGPGGLTAGIYAGRAQLKTGMIERLMPGGQVAGTELIENYPGFADGVAGPDLMMAMEKQARKFGLEIMTGTIESLDFKSAPKKVVASGKTYYAKAVIISTGTDPKLLNIPGEKEFKGRGVSYCATCDGPFFKDKDVVVVGGGSSGVQESLYLTRFVNKINLVEFMDHLNAERILQERAKKNQKYTFYLNHQMLSINGSQKVESVTVKNRATEEAFDIPAEGVFIWVGMNPNTEFLQNHIDINPWGYIVAGEDCQTSVPGVFAVGDVRDKEVRQITTAVSDGTVAAEHALKYVESQEN
ncbi:thioredoxin-disulfide reductase [bacterium]|nr:thioredoxin-disulfide reductase [bacterium]